MRKLILVAVGAALVGAFVAAPSGLRAQLGCWGSICQDPSGTIFLSKSVSAQNLISLSTVPGALTIPGDLVVACTRTKGLPPGFQGLALRGRPGTQPGTMKVVLIAGTSQVETVLLDNIPGGSC